MSSAWIGGYGHYPRDHSASDPPPAPASDPADIGPLTIEDPTPLGPAPIVGPPELAHAPSPLAGLSISTAGRRRRPDGDDGIPSPGMIYSHRMLLEYRQQTKADREARQSVPEDDTLRRGPLDTIEPPFDFDALTTLLFDAPDFYAIVDRIATDVCGPWTLVDAEEVAATADLPLRDRPGAENGDEPFTGEELGDLTPTPQIEADLAGEIPEPEPRPSTPPARTQDPRGATPDDAAIEQRRQAKALLESLTFDLSGTRIKLREFSKMVIKDYKATGNGGIEVGRDAQGRVKGLIYIPFRLIRKLVQNRGWVEIDHAQRPVAYFRNYGSEPSLPESQLTELELKSLGRDSIQDHIGELKNELYHLKHHHPNEIHYGVPPIIPALGAVTGNMHADARNLRYFLNRAVPDYLTIIKADTLTLTGEGTREVIDQFEQGLDEQLQLAARGSDYENAVLRIPKDVMEFEMKPLGSAINDAEFMGYKVANRDTQLRVYGMPPSRLGIIETANLGTGSGETQLETYKRAIVDPDQEMLEDLYNAILDEYGLTLVRFQYKDIDIVDEQREMQLYSAASAAGAISVNEEREWLSRITADQDFPPFEEAEETEERGGEIPEADIPATLREGDAGGFGLPVNGGPLFAQGERQGIPGEVPSPAQPQAVLPPPQRRRRMTQVERAIMEGTFGRRGGDRRRVRLTKTKNGGEADG